MMEKVANIDWISIGKMVKSFRRQRKLSHRTLAQRAGVSKGTVQRLESGKPVRSITLNALEKALNITPGVLSVSGPPCQGPFHVPCPKKDFIVLKPNPQCKRKLPKYSQDVLMDPSERARIGMLGFASAFHWETEMGLLGSSMKGAVLEIYSETEANQHDGEELVFAVKGSVKVTVNGQSFVVNEHRFAVFWSGEPHVYAPATEALPVLIFSVRIDPPADRHASSRRRNEEGHQNLNPNDTSEPLA
jgi:transcriptional regulator with XRE-family HTH domain